MNALVCSGGGAKGAYTAGVVCHMVDDQNLDFKIAIGTSTGALIGGPVLLENWRYLRNVYVGITDKDILKNSWLGKLASIFLPGKVPLQADMTPLYDLLKEYYIDGKKLRDLRRLNKTLVVTAVNVRTGKLEFVSSADVGRTISEETFVKGIVASASEPVFTHPIQIYENEPGHPHHKDLYYDGGVREFMPLEHAVELGASAIYAVSTHPLKYNITKWGGSGKPKDTNLLNALKWLIDTALNEVERGDLYRALVCYRLGRARDQIRTLAADADLDPAVADDLQAIIDDILPDIPDRVGQLYVIAPTRMMSASLEFDPRVMFRYFNNGILAAQKFFGNGGPPLFEDAGDFVTTLGG